MTAVLAYVWLAGLVVTLIVVPRGTTLRITAAVLWPVVIAVGIIAPRGTPLRVTAGVFWTIVVAVGIIAVLLDSGR